MTKDTQTEHGPHCAVIGTLPGDGWIVERIETDNSHTVLPLPGWLVTADGEVHPLPGSVNSTWSVRPRTDEDDRLIAVSANRLRSNPKPTTGSYFR